MAAVAAAARSAVELAGPRLVEAYYLVQVSTSTIGLDAAATIIKARRGRILSNEAREGQDLFVITAHVPVEACLSKRGGGGGESGAAAKRQGRQLSFADDLRREASGAASASLAMSHWERLQVRLPCACVRAQWYTALLWARCKRSTPLSCCPTQAAST